MRAQDIVIDGDTLEKRREQRKEQLERFIWEMPKEEGPGFLNMVNQWTKGTGVRRVPASQSLFDLNAPDKRLRQYAETGTFTDVPPVIKRTPDERVLSMARRLQGADPVQNEKILGEIQSEYWKSGMPVAMEDLRAIAAHFLNRAERKAKTA